ncbi:MAG: Hsp20/alpha crystallin family protein [Minisyncoccales bacterium]|jgi:HSP20 family protein
MAITPWKPFIDLDRIMRSELDLIEPDMDLYEKDNKIVAEFSLPELDPNKTEISVKDNILKVKGSTESKKENFVRREIRRGYFERVISLPSPVKKENIEAVYEKGILKIEMEKEKEQEQTQKIKIRLK